MNSPLLALGIALITGLPLAAHGQPGAHQPSLDAEGVVPDAALRAPPSRAGAPSLRCYQHGTKVVDNELPPGTTFGAEPPAGTVQLRSPGKQRIWLLPLGEGLCLVRLQAATAPAPEAGARQRHADPATPGPD